MKKTAIRDYIDKINRQCEKIRILTEPLLSFNNGGEFLSALSQRSRLIDDITASARRLDELDADWKAIADRDAQLNGATDRMKRMIASITDTDSLLMQMIQQRMQELKAKLASLHQTAGAARSYAFHATGSASHY